MESLQEIKDKLKKVANAWTEINSLSSTAIYDINDTNVNWNKKVVLEDVKDIVDKRIHIETPAPTKKDETKPKQPQKISTLVIVLNILLGICVIPFIPMFFLQIILTNETLIFYVTFIISSILTTIGISMLFVYYNNNKYALISNKKRVKKIISVFGYLLAIIGTGYLITSIIILLINNFKDFIAFILFSLLLMFSISFAVYNFTIYKYKIIIYYKNLKMVEENIKYNNEQYPKDLKEYNKNYLNLCNEQVRKINTTHKKIGEYFNKIEEIDIISISQAKYAQTLLDYIYKGAESIKEAFEKLESEKEKVDKQIEEENQKLKSISNKVYENNANNEKKDNNINSKSKWKRLSKLAKSAIIVPIITIGLPIIWFIISSILQSNPENINALVGMTMIMNIISYVLIGGTAVFESVAFAILCYRKFRKDFKGK